MSNSLLIKENSALDTFEDEIATLIAAVQNNSLAAIAAIAVHVSSVAGRITTLHLAPVFPSPQEKEITERALTLMTRFWYQLQDILDHYSLQQQGKPSYDFLKIQLSYSHTIKCMQSIRARCEFSQTTARLWSQFIDHL